MAVLSNVVAMGSSMVALSFSLPTDGVMIWIGRVRMWRDGLRVSLSVTALFVCRCLNSRTITPFPHSPYRTGHADLPHPALGQELTSSHFRSHCRDGGVDGANPRQKFIQNLGWISEAHPPQGSPGPRVQSRFYRLHSLAPFTSQGFRPSPCRPEHVYFLPQMAVLSQGTGC